jgi:transcriptional regulator with XRE-family HTH domain
MSIGKNIKELRKAKNITQKGLGEAVGLSEGQISHYEVGRTIPPLGVIEEIAKVLEVSPRDIIGNYNLIIDQEENHNPPFLPDQEKAWIAEKNRLLLKIDQLQDKLLDISEKKLESLDDATREIITLNAEVRELRRKLKE